MFKRCWLWGLALSAMLMAQGVMAFPCFITISKDNCWTNYSVMIDVLDGKTQKIITTITIPKGETWSRGRFEAKPKQVFMLRAKFEPAVWKVDEGKIYYAKHYWLLPEKVKGDTKAWHIGVCYPKSFSSVPLPPGADSKCICPKQDIPNQDG